MKSFLRSDILKQPFAGIVAICLGLGSASGAIYADFAIIGEVSYYPSPIPGTLFAGEIGLGGWFSVSDGGGIAVLTAETWFLGYEFAFYPSTYGAEFTARPDIASSAWMTNGAPSIPASVDFDTPQYFAVYYPGYIELEESFGWFALSVSPSLEVQGLGSAINRGGPGIRVGTLEAVPEPGVPLLMSLGVLGLLLRKRSHVA